ncbi:recombinase family protein [Sphingobium scionense]|uniref:DNA invertase Pin-like site-specific DNA recombinase n=2 Tax=Sphingobium scionense TaxID=1404341 RepID=A0A7W6PXB8_9SPHN|nr:recombinase family protein [Sphingobium scionense]MBB4149082.1 DNA invertase Pin-like site-specific DNA recombinase [Sphingobium scionense]
MRTILYARYSSDLQNALSTADQLAGLKERVEREGWTVVGSFHDDEISGRAGIGEMQRPGLNAMLARVELGDVDQVLAEATDRIARHSGDAHAVREHLEHFGARLFTLADGHVDEITGTIKGLMDSRFLKDLADRVRRGQRGQHSRGFNAGGRAYGYRVVKPIGPDGEVVRGILEINEEEAAVIRRIFDEVIEGRSAYAIVRQLNAEGIAAPAGGKWRIGTIHGDRARANGILRNNLYRGIMVYNRTKRVYHPKTRRRLVRTNPPEQWYMVDVPHLRIVSDAQWVAIEAQYAAFDGTKLEKRRRPKRLLSKLGRCSVCGGAWTIVSPDKWGCSERKTRDGCSNTRTISNRKYEARVLGDLKQILLDTDAVALFIDRYNAGIRKRQAEAIAARDPLERKLIEARGRVSRLVDAIADGAGEFQEVKDRLRKARAELAELERKLGDLITPPPITVSQDLGDRYREYVDHLDTALAADGMARERAVAAIRSLIDVIILSPAAEGRGVDVRVEGRMAEIINLAKQEERYANVGAG